LTERGTDAPRELGVTQWWGEPPRPDSEDPPDAT
jgi:hypothetical protein